MKKNLSSLMYGKSLLLMAMLFPFVLSAQLSGTYTIGAAGDYASFNAARTALAAGVSGPVVFNVAAGTYTEQVTFTAIAGASATNTITFQSSSGDSTSVILQYAAASTTDNWVVRLNGASFITFKQMTIRATGASNGRVFEYMAAANKNTITNCVIQTNTTLTTSSFAGIYSTTNIGSNHLKVTNNLFIGGYYSIYWYGSSTNKKNHLVVENNILRDFYYYGVQTYYADSVFLTNNEMINRTTSGITYAAYVYYNNGYSEITKNKIHLQGTSSQYGITSGYKLTASTAPMLIANNFVSQSGSTGTVYGIYLLTTNYVDVYFNSVNVTGGSLTAGRALFQSSGTNIRLLNNILVNTGGGYAIYASTTTGITQSDYNNFYATGTALGYWNAADRANLADWKTASSRDANSLSLNPSFVSTTDLHTSYISLWKAGTTVAGIIDDIDGDLRDPLAPCIGADEFMPPQNDAGVVSVDAPAGAVPPGSHAVKVSIKNFGLAALTSAVIKYNVNGGTTYSYNWSGNLAVGTAAGDINLGNYTFVAGEADIKAWTESPSGQIDGNHTNDTATSKVFICNPMAGTYTIGGAGADFPNFASAINQVKGCGVSAPVIFNVTAGIYTEQLTFVGQIPGASSVNTVTFKSASGDSTDVTVQFASLGTTDNWVVRINGTSYLKFSNMTFKATGISYGYVFEFMNGASYNTISNCSVESSTTSTSSFYTCIYSTSNQPSNYVAIENSRLLGGYYSVYWYATSATQKMHFTMANNIVENYYYYGLYLYRTDSTIIVNNTLTNRANSGVVYAIYHYYADGYGEIVKNRIHLSGTSTQYGISVGYKQTVKPDYLLVANNFLSQSGSTGTVYGLYNIGANYVNYYNNSVHIGGGSTSAGRAMFMSSGTNINIVNNILANTNAGYAYYVNAPSAVTRSDYNCYFSTGINMAYWSANRADLSALKSANGLDQNSVSVNPGFASVSDLHVSNTGLNGKATPLAEITDDIDGDPRAAFPDIGADEFIPVGKDAAIVWVAPVPPATAGNKTVQVEIGNTMSVVITSLDLVYTDGVNPPVMQSFTGLNIASDASQLLSFATPYSFTGPTQLRAYITAVNGSADLVQENDTTNWTNIVPALSGVYTINNTVATGGTNFNSFAAAVQAMTDGGVLGAVTFNVAAGIYTEQISIGEILGVSASSPVIFQSASGDSTSVILRFDSPSTDNYVLRFNGADFIMFKKITISALNTSYGYAVVLINGAENNEISNCVILSAGTSMTSTAGIYSPGTGSNKLNLIKGNRIEGGYYGLYIYGLSSPYSLLNRIEENEISNVYYYNMFLYYQDSIQVKNNNITRISGPTANYGIYGYYLYNGSSITGNNININTASTAYGMAIYNSNNGLNVSGNTVNTTNTTTNYGILLSSVDYRLKVDKNIINTNSTSTCYSLYLSSCDGIAGQPIVVANNMVSHTGNTGTAYTLYLATNTYLDVYHNSIRTNGGSTTAGRALMQTGGSNQNFKNNIFANFAGGFAYYITTNTAVLTSDYNDYYTTGAVVAYWNALNRNTLADLRSANFMDANSVSMNPEWFSINDLRTKSIAMNNLGTPIVGITDDIFGNTRNATTPDIGAFEYTPPANDVAVTSITPLNPLSGNQNVMINFISYGTQTLTTATFNFSVNGTVNSTPYVYSGSLSNGQSAVNVNIGGFAFQPGVNVVKAWVININGGADEDNTNDTATYTINIVLDAGIIAMDEAAIQYGSSPVNVFVANYGTDNLTSAILGWAVNGVAQPTVNWTGMITSGNADGPYLLGNYNFTAGTYEIKMWTQAPNGSIDANATNDTLVKYFTFSVDAGISQIDAPGIPGVQNVNVHIKNFANIPLTAANIFYQVNGGAVSSAYSWTGNVSTNNSQGPVVIGTGAFAYGPNTIKAWTDSPNGGTDANNNNDTLEISFTISLDIGISNGNVGPHENCGRGLDTLSVEVKNYGSGPVSGPFSVSYQIVGSATVVTESVPSTVTLLPGDVYWHTFSTLMNLAVSGQDSVFTIKGWTSLANDANAANDTAGGTVDSWYIPTAPLTENDTVTYGSPAQLVATLVDGDKLNWYDDMAGYNLVFVGDTFNTAIMTDTTTFYVSAQTMSPAPPPVSQQVGTGAVVNQYLPIEPYYGYSYSQSIYLASELGTGGKITHLKWNFAGTSLSLSNNWTIYVGHTSKTTFTSTTDWVPVTGLTQVYSGVFADPGAPGWITFDITDFQYNGTDNLVIAVDENVPNYNGSGDDFFCTFMGSNRSIYFYSDGTNPNPASPPTGNLSQYISNIIAEISFDPTDKCEGPRTPVTAIVTNIPSDAGVTYIAEVTETGTHGIVVALKNFTSVILNSASVSYEVNGVPGTTYSWTGSLAKDDSVMLNLGSAIFAYGPNTIKAWSSLPNGSADPDNTNDTTLISFTIFSDIGVVAVNEPIGGCGLGNQTVIVDVKNFGSDTVHAYAVNYTLVGGTATVTENVTAPLAPGATYTHIFAAQANLSVAADSTFIIKAFTTLTGDANANNDTTLYNVFSAFTPVAPIVKNDTVNYGDGAVLTAVSDYLLYWFNAAIGGTQIATGDTFWTPPLFDTTTYYVEARSGKADLKITEVSHYHGFGTGATSPAPAWLQGDDFVEITNLGTSPADLTGHVLKRENTGPFTYNLPSVTLAPGAVMVLATFGATTASPANNFYIAANSSVSSNSIAGYWIEDPTGAVVDAVAMSGHSFSVGSGVTAADWTGAIANASGMAGVVRIASDNNNASDWVLSSVVQQNLGTINAGLAPQGMTCVGPRSAVTAIVENFPALDVGVTKVNSPQSGVGKTNAEILNVTVKNYGTVSVDTIPLQYIFEAGSPVVDTLFATLSPGDTANFSFATPMNMAVRKTYNLSVTTALNGDVVTANDGLTLQVIHSDYCISRATNTADDDIGNVTIKHPVTNATLLSNGVASPLLSNPLSNKLYSNFSGNSPTNLEQGQSYPFSMTQIELGATFYPCSLKVYIDFNQNGILDPVTELVYSGRTGPTAAGHTLTGTIAIPSNATPGNTRMRFVLDETGTAPPCGTYSYGETEDYTVNIVPQVWAEAGSGQIICNTFSAVLTGSGTGPTFAWSEGSGNPVTVSPVVTTTYYLSVTDTYGFTAVDSVVVLVNDLPVLSFPALSSVCVNASPFALTTATPAGGNYYGTGVNANSFNPTTAGVNTHTLKYIYSDLNGCTDSITQSIVVIALPTATTTMLPQAICYGDSVQLSVDLTGTGPWNLTVNDGSANMPVTGVATSPWKIWVKPLVSTTYSIIDVSDVNCTNTSSASVTVTVNPLPVVFAGVDKSIPYGTNTTISDATASGAATLTYAWTPADSFVVANILNPTTYNLQGPGVYTLKVTDGNFCVNTDQLTISVTGGPLNATPVATPAIVCPGDSVLIVAWASGGSGAYTYSWTGSTSTDSAIYVNPTDTTTYTVTINDGFNFITRNITVNVYPLADINFATVNDACVDAASFALNVATPAGGIYSGTGISAGNFNPAVAGVGTHYIVYTYTDANTCVSVDSTSITVNPLPMPVITPSGATTFCDGYSVNLVAQTGFSSYSWTGGPAPAGSAFIKFDFNSVAPDGNTATGSNVPSLGTATLTNVGGVNNTYATGAGSSDPASTDNSAYNTNTYPAQGTNSGTAGIEVAVSTVGQQNISISWEQRHSATASRYYQLQYSLDGTNYSAYSGAGTDVNGLYMVDVANTFFTFTANLSGVAGAGNNPNFKFRIVSVFGPATSAYTAVGATSTYGTSGTCRFDMLSVSGTPAGTNTLTVTETGVYVVNVTNASGCSNASASVSVTVNPLPVITMTPLANMCTNGASLTLANASPTGGAYSGPGVTAGVLNPAIAGAGTHYVVYTYIDGNTCANSDSVSVTVNVPTAITMTALSPVCANAASFTLTNATPLGGLYSGTGVSAGVFNPAVAGAGSHTIYYTYIDLNSCTSVDSVAILVHPAPVITMTALTDLCIDAAPLTLTNATPAGGTYSGTGVTTGVFTPSVAGAGTHYVLYTFTNAQNCTDIDSVPIIVNALPVVTFGTVPSSFCIDDTAIILTGTPGGGASCTSNCAMPTTCTSASTNFAYEYITNVSINGASQTSVGSIYTDYTSVLFSTLTAGSSYTLSGTAYTDANDHILAFIDWNRDGVFSAAETYTLSSNTSASTNHQFSLNITVPSGASLGLVKMRISLAYSTPPSACGTWTYGEVEDYMIEIVGAGSGTGVFSGPGVSGNLFTPSVAGAGAAHVLTYTFTDGNGCINSATTTVAVNALPVVSITGLDPSYCSNGSTDVLTGTPAGGTFTGTGMTANVFDPSTAGAGSHTIIYNYTDLNTCTNSDTVSALVHLAPVPVITGLANAYCANDAAATLTLTPAGGTLAGAGVTGSTFDPSLVLGPISLTYTYTDLNNCTDSATELTTVHAVPLAVAGADTGFVCGDTVQLGDATAATGVSYLWTPSTGLNSATVHDPNAFPLTTTVYIVEVTDNTTLCVNSDTVTVSVTPITVIAGTDTTICEGAPITFTATGATDYVWSHGDSTATTVVSPMLTTTYFVNGSNPNGCFAVDSVVVTTIVRPVADAGIDTTICYGTPATLLATGGTDYLWNTGGTTASMVVTPLANTTYHVTVTDASTGCDNTDSVAVFVHMVVFTMNDTVALTSQIIVDAGPGYYSYLWSTGATSRYALIDTAGVGMGIKMVWCEVTDITGCAGRDTMMVDFTTIGLNQIAGTQQMKVYPNPSSDIFNVAMSGFANSSVNVCVLNLQGQVVRCEEWMLDQGAAIRQIDMGTMPRGVYFLRLTSDKLHLVERIVVK